MPDSLPALGRWGVPRACARLAGAALAAAASLAAMGALTSCASPQARSLSEYIGPMAERGPSLSAASQAEPASAPATTPRPQGGPLELTVQQAILLALESNRSLAVERLNPPIRGTLEDQERVVFDPVVSASASAERQKAESASRSLSTTDSYSAEASADAFLPTGTSVELTASTQVLDSSLYSDDLAASRVGLSVTQALLRGAGVRVNLASLRQARLDTLASEYELRGFAEALLAEVETAYWDCALAGRQIEIFTNSMHLAQQQLEETQERIKVGTLAETELAAAQAEVSLRRENLINARSRLETARLQLLQLLNAADGDLWDRQIVLLNQPTVPEVRLEGVESHVQVALRMRPELNQARLAVQRGDLELVKTKNGLLPRMDLFVTLGKTGYADSFGRSVGDPDEHGYDVLAGVAFEYPPINRDARARHSRALLSREQSAKAVDNLAQLVELDVRTAFIEVNRAREQIAATAVTRKYQAEALRAEVEKFRVGKSTSLLVAQAQRDLLASQITEIQVTVNYLKALVQLHRLEGSLLERRGIAAPGREPVVLREGN